MKFGLLAYLRCIACGSRLELQAETREGEEIIAGIVHCLACDRQYPVVRGVPRMLPEYLSKEAQATAEAFGYEWLHFRQLTDQYKAQFLDWIAPIPAQFFRGKVVLDAGCGKGRHTYLATQFGARDAIGVDLGEAVEAAFENTRDLPNVHIVQADLHHLPFDQQTFDFICSIGVLHHLPDPKKGFFSLLPHLKAGGTIAAWVYGWEGNGWIVRIVNPIRLFITSKLPKSVTRFLAWSIACVLQPTIRYIYRPVNRLAWLQSLKRFLFYNEYLYSISGFSFRENYSIIFDHLVAPTAFYIPQQEFESWFTEGQLREVLISQRNSNSWRGKGRKI